MMAYNVVRTLRSLACRCAVCAFGPLLAALFLLPGAVLPQTPNWPLVTIEKVTLEGSTTPLSSTGIVEGQTILVHIKTNSPRQQYIKLQFEVKDDSVLDFLNTGYQHNNPLVGVGEGTLNRQFYVQNGEHEHTIKINTKLDSRKCKDGFIRFTLKLGVPTDGKPLWHQYRLATNALGSNNTRKIQVKDAGPCATISIDPDSALERDGITEGGAFDFTLRRINPSNNDPAVSLNWEVVDDSSRDFLESAQQGRKSHDLPAFYFGGIGEARNVTHNLKVQTQIDPASGNGEVTVRLLEGDYYLGTKTTLTVPVKDDTGYAGRVLSLPDLKVAEDHSYQVSIGSFIPGFQLPFQLSGDIEKSVTNPSVRVSFVDSGGLCKATANARDLGQLGTGINVLPRTNYPPPKMFEWDTSRPESRERSISHLLMDDEYHEGDETLCLKFDQPKSLKLPGGAEEYFAAITITDDDPSPTIEVDSPRAAEGAGTLDFTVTLTNPPQGKDVTVDYDDNGKGSATSGTDYTKVTAGKVTFPANAGDTPQKKTVSVTLKEDGDVEDDETVALRFKRAQNADFKNNARGITVRGIIADDDSYAPQVRLREAAKGAGPVTVQEGGTAVFHADVWVHENGEWKIGSVNRDLRLRLVLRNSGSSLASASLADIRSNVIRNGAAILRSGESGIKIEMEAISDDGDEPVEAFRLELTSDLDQFAKRSVAKGVIYDGPTLRIAAPKGPATEGGRLRFPVTLGTPATTDISVAWKTESLAKQTAEAGKDYTAASGTLVFKAGETDKVIRIKTLQDNIDEPSEDFSVVLTDPNVTGLDLGPLRARGIIRDDDKRPAITIADASVEEGDTLTLPITLNPAPAVPVRLEWRVRAPALHGATRGADYTGNESGTITVAAGESSAKVEFPTIDDNVDEASETFEVALVVLREDPVFFSSQRARQQADILAPLTATATILDNDTPRLSINDLVVEEGKSAVFKVRLSSPRTYPVEVEFNTEDGGGPERRNLSNQLVSDDARGTGTAKDYDGVTTPITVRFAPGETEKKVPPIRVVHDDELESHSEYFRGVISLKPGADSTKAVIDKPIGLVKIRDIDTTRYWIANKDTTVREGRPVRIRVKRDRTEFAATGLFGCIEGTGLHDALPNGGTAHAGTTDRTYPTPFDKIDVFTVEKDNFASACGQAGDGAKLAFFSFAEGEDEASFWVNTVDDDRKEHDETFFVWIDGIPNGGNDDFPQGATVRDHLRAKTLFTILDDDDIHRFRVVSANSPWEGEDAHFDIYVDSDAALAALKASTNLSVLLKLGAATDTAKEGTHYQTIPHRQEPFDLASVNSKTQRVGRIVVPTIGDDTLDGDKTLTISFSEIFAGVSTSLPFRPAPGGGTATVTIRDDEAYHLSIDDAVGDEGDDAAIRIALSKPAEQDFMIRFRTRQGTAKAPGDFTACGPKDASCALMFPEGATEALFRVPTTEDTVPEETEEFRVVIQEVDYANLVINDLVAVVKIRDDDARSVTITGLQDVDVSENEEWTSPVPAWEGAPDGGVAWTLEGDDATQFAIDPDTGVLTLPAQNFEAPADGDKDNVHEITVRVTDEDGNTAAVALSVTVTDVVYGYLYLQASDLASHDKVSVDTATGRVSAEEGVVLSVPVTYGNRTANAGSTFRYSPRPAGALQFLNFGFKSSLSGTARAGDITAHDAAGGGVAWANSEQYGVVPTVTLVDDGLAEGAETFSVTYTPENDDVPVRIWTGTKHINSDTLQIEIVDNDTQGVTITSVALSLDETDDTTTQDTTENVGTYTVVLDSQPAAGTVTVAAESGDTKAATVSPASLTFNTNNWKTPQTITVTTVDDDVDNTDDKRTVTVTHTVTAAGEGNDYGAVTAEDVTVTVTNDDARGVTVAPNRLTVRETDDTTTAGMKENEAVYTIVLDSKPAAGTVTVAVASGDVAAATVSPARLTFNTTNWNTPRTVTVTGVDDNTDNPGDRRTVNVTHTVTAAGNGNDYAAVTDADPVVVLVTETGYTRALEIRPRELHLQESDIASTTAKKENEQTYEVRLNFVPSADARVAISLTPATTRLRLDKNALTFTSANWNDWQTIKVTAVDDDVQNDPLAQEVEIGHSVTGAGGVSVAAGSVTATVYDDDALNQLSFDSPSVAEGDSGEATLTFTLTLSRPAQESLSVLLNPFVAGTTATPTPVGATPVTPGPTHDFDRSDIDNRTVTFAVGDRTKTFGVTVYGDVRHEGDETVRVHVQSRKPSSLVLAPGLPREGIATGVANAIASGTITDDDAAPDGIALSLDPNTERSTPDSTPEGRKGQRNFDVVATTRGDTVYGEDVTVILGIGAEGDTATLDEDFEADFWKSGTVSRSVELVLREGKSSVKDSVEFRLRPTDDMLDEANEVLSVTGVSGDIEITPATHTITDDDDLPTVSVADAVAVAEGDDPETTTDMTFMVTLSTASGKTITVPYTLSGTATEDEDYTGGPDPPSIDIAPSTTTGTITIPIKGDAIDEVDETVIVTLGIPINATVSTADGAGTGTGIITDDDTRGVTVTPTTLTLAEIDDSKTNGTTENVGTYEVVLTSQPTGDVTVTITNPAQSPVTISATQLTFTTVNWADPQTVTVTARNDNIDNTDDKRTVTLTHAVSGADYADETVAPVTVTVTDDDTATLLIADATGAEGGTMTFTITLSTPSAVVVTVTAITVEGSGARGATAPEDYTHKTQELSFAAGDTTKDFTVAIASDSVAELDETFTVSLSGATGATITDDEATGTITGADALLSIADASAAEGDTLSFTVTRTGDTSGAASVQWTTIDDTTQDADKATATTDYTPQSAAATLSFNANEATAILSVATAEDVIDEPNETLRVVLASPSAGVALADDMAIGAIIDDDAAPTGITLTVDKNTVGEGDATATTVTVTATVNGSTRYTDAKTVTVSVGGGTATSGTDYTAVTNFDITIPAGAASATGTFDLAPIQDSLHEGAETLDVTGVSGTITATKAGISITDDDSAPSFASADASAAEGDAITFTVTRSGATGAAAAVNWNTAPDTTQDAKAAATTDYTAVTTAQTLSFAVSETTKTFTVATTEDSLHEGDETFLVKLTAPTGGATITDDEATGTITDDDAKPTKLTLTVDADTSTEGAQTSVTENGGAKTVRVTATLGGTSTFTTATTVTVKVGASTDSATESTDYATVADQTITIAANASSAHVDFTLTPKQDRLAEDDESIALDGTATGLDVTDTAITLTDDDAAPTGITLTVDKNTVGEGDATATTVTVTATVNGSTRYTDAKTVTVSVGGGTATSGTDYTAVTNFDITIPAGAASATGTFDLAPIQDSLHEGAETLDVTGVSGTITATKAGISITDDDSAPSFASADASAAEGDAITFTVTRSGATGAAAAVNWNTAPDTTQDAKAAATTDYTAVTTAQTLSFAVSETTKTFTVATTEDSLHEGDETFLVKLTAPTGGATITDDEATGTITDDDAKPTKLTLTVDADTSTEGAQTSVTENGGAKTVRVTATLGGTSTFTTATTVTVKVGASTDSATESTDYATVADQTITIAANASSAHVDFTLTPKQDRLAEDDESIALDGTATGLDVTDTAITLTDDDAAPTGITLTVDKNTVGEGDATATTVTVTATVNGSTRYTDAKTVTVSVGGGTATSGTDYTAVTNFDITIPAGAASATGTFDLAPIQDSLHEGAETLDVTGVSGTITATKAGISITDDDSAPSFASADASAAEGDAITFTVTRSGATGAAAAVNWNTAPDTTQDAKAAATTDYTAVTTAQTLSFAVSETTKTFTVATTEDSLHEGDETFLVKLTAPTGGATITDDEATGTITDDDAKPTKLTLTVDADTSTEGAQTSVTENGGAKTVRVTATLGGTSTFTTATTVTVKVGASTDSATESTDYATVADQTITIAANASSAHVDFTLTPKQDRLAEDDESIALDGTATGLDVTDTAITLTDDDAAPTGITLTVDKNTVGEGDATATTVTVTATVNGSTRYTDAKTVTVSVGGGTATSGTDYTAVTNFDITIPAGAASATGTFDLAPIQDSLHEGAETLDVTGVSGTITATKAGISITDDDSAPSFASADASAAEGDAITFTVTRSGATGAAAAVNWNTAPDTTQDAKAAATTDYTAVTTAQTLSFAVSETTKTFTVATTEDSLHEGDETFLVKLTAPTGGATITDDEATGTITDDDIAPSFAIADASATEGDAITFTITRSGVTDAAASVKWNTANSEEENAASTADYTAVTTAQTLSFAVSETTKTFIVATTEDILAEGDETFLVKLSDATGATISDDEAIGTITDDDDALDGITLAVNPSSVSEGAGATEITVTATFDGDSTIPEDTIVTVSVGGGTATPDEDYAAVSDFEITITAGEVSGNGTFTLTPTDNDEIASDKSIIISGISGDLTITPVTLTIINDDVALNSINLAVDPSSVSEDAGATEIIVTATVNGDSTIPEDTIVTVSVGGGTATPDEDYAAVSDFDITIAAGESSGSGTFTLTPTDNDEDVPDKSIIISGTSNDLNVSPATLAITNDDESVTIVTTIDDDEAEPSIITVYAAVPSTAGTARLSSRALPLLANGLSSNSQVTEGDPAMFMLNAQPIPKEKPLGVNLMVIDAPTPSDFIAATHEGSRSVSIPIGQNETSVSVPTENDDTDEPDSRVAVEVMSGTGYSSGSPATAFVIVNDDDPTVVTLSLLDVTVTAGEADEAAALRITLNRGLMNDEYLEVPIAVAGGIRGEGYDLKLTGTPHGVTLVNDRIIFAGNGRVPTASVVDFQMSAPADAPGGTLVVSIPESSVKGNQRLVAINMGGGAVGIRTGDGRIAIKGIVPPPVAWLARFGRTVSEQVLTTITDRISASRRPGLEGALAGQGLPNSAGETAGSLVTERETALEYTDGLDPSFDSLSFIESQHDFRAVSPEQTHAVTEREALLTSEFSLTAPTDGSGGSFAFWGQMSRGSFGGTEGNLSLEGHVTTGMLGADYARGRWLAGLLLSRSTGDGDQSGVEAPACLAGQGSEANPCAGPLRDGNADIEASLTSAVAYAALRQSERMELWGALGHGAGELMVKTPINGIQRTDTAWTMAAAGLRNDLVEVSERDSGPMLTLASDALWMGISSDRTRFLEASNSYVTRLRLGLEAGWSIDLEGDGSLAPRLEAGLRYDGGDAETGFGVDIGGGIKWTVPSSGISFDASGRVLAVHQDGDFKDWGVSASFAWDPDPATKRGPSINLVQELGNQSGGGLDALFASGPPGTVNTVDGRMRISLDMAYGFGRRYGMVGGPYGRLSGGGGIPLRKSALATGLNRTPHTPPMSRSSSGLNLREKTASALDWNGVGER